MVCGGWWLCCDCFYLQPRSEGCIRLCMPYIATQGRCNAFGDSVRGSWPLGFLPFLPLVFKNRAVTASVARTESWAKNVPS